MTSLLVQILQKHDFVQSDLIPRLFKHKTRPLCFSLVVVDDFGVSYVGKEHANFFIQVLQHSGYTITHDWTGSIFCGTRLNWDYANVQTLDNPHYELIGYSIYLCHGRWTDCHISVTSSHSPLLRLSAVKPFMTAKG